MRGWESEAIKLPSSEGPAKRATTERAANGTLHHGESASSFSGRVTIRFVWKKSCDPCVDSSLDFTLEMCQAKTTDVWMEPETLEKRTKSWM